MLKFSPTLEQEILQEAREIEQTPGPIRPITINLFGLMLRQFQALPSNYRSGTLLRSYLCALIRKTQGRDLTPHVLRCL